MTTVVITGSIVVVLLRRVVTSGVAACLALGAVACGSAVTPSASATGAAGHQVIPVVAAENMWGDLAAQIGGSHVRVRSIISDPNVDPHTYSSDPQDAIELATARLVIANGLGYDDFVPKILSSTPSTDRSVLTVATTLGITSSNANPHLWYDTAKLPVIANVICADLSAIDPADAAAYTSNTRRFDASLAPLLATIATIKRSYAGTPVGYTERVPGYLLQAAGLTVATPAQFSQAVEDGDTPSPADTVAFDSAITSHRIKVLLVNTQVVDAQTARVKALAIASHVPVVDVTETLPTGLHLQTWQLDQDKALLAALRG